MAKALTDLPQLAQNDVPEEFQGPVIEDAQVWPDSDWWNAFNDEELSNLIDIVQVNNLDLDNNRRNLESAQIALREAGFKGLKCTSPYYAYDHDLYMPIYEEAQKLKMPIVFHTGRYRANPGDQLRQRPSIRNMQPLTLDRVARSFPDLKIIMAHLGTSLFRREAADLLRLHPNLYADLAGSGSWKALSSAELAHLLKPPVPGGGPEFRYFEQLLLGSDAYTSIPHLMEESQGCYENLLTSIGVTESIQKKIMLHFLS